MEFLPAPVQCPRIPLWVGGSWPDKAAMRRAARWDGAIPIMLPDPSRVPSPGMMRDSLAFIQGLRAEAGLGHQRFDLILGGTSPPGAAPATSSARSPRPGPPGGMNARLG